MTAASLALTLALAASPTQPLVAEAITPHAFRVYSPWKTAPDATCDAPLGVEPTLVPESLRPGAQLALMVGPLRQGTLTVTDAQGVLDQGRCRLLLLASTDDAAPTVTRNDFVWAAPLGTRSSAHLPASGGSARRAVTLMRTLHRDGCAAPEVVARGARAGAFVQVRCEEASGLVFVPRRGSPRLLAETAGDRGDWRLLDVLDPSASRGHHLVFSRKDTAEVELWVANESWARQLDTGARLASVE